MAAAKYDFTIEQGATFRRRITYKANGTAVNLTGATARMKAKRSDGSIVFSLTELAGITLGGTSGTIDLYISDSETAAFNFDTALHDLEITLANGDVKRLFKGVVMLSRETTT
jgi:hypothetical protein